MLHKGCSAVSLSVHWSYESLFFLQPFDVREMWERAHYWDWRRRGWLKAPRRPALHYEP
jgi:hypothetical protein